MIGTKETQFSLMPNILNVHQKFLTFDQHADPDNDISLINNVYNSMFSILSSLLLPYLPSKKFPSFNHPILILPCPYPVTHPYRESLKTCRLLPRKSVIQAQYLLTTDKSMKSFTGRTPQTDPEKAAMNSSSPKLNARQNGGEKADRMNSDSGSRKLI